MLKSNSTRPKKVTNYTRVIKSYIDSSQELSKKEEFKSPETIPLQIGEDTL